MNHLLVLAALDPASLSLDDKGFPVISKEDEEKDAFDLFNHSRMRRALILRELLQRKNKQNITFQIPSIVDDWTSVYKSTHTAGVLEFLSTAWSCWERLGPDGQDPMGGTSKLLILGNSALPRETHQRPSKHVLGQIGYYCTDNVTPIFVDLLSEMTQDASLVQAAVEQASPETTMYVIPVHPGHHAASDSFGGYCYVNHVAAAARLIQTPSKKQRVAILDVDYHAGNGTMSIFYNDPTVLVVSIHCDPDWDYPFHSGFDDQRGAKEGFGTTLNLPLLPGTTWETYQEALQEGLKAIHDFGAHALIVSLGLDTYERDPCAIRRAGFSLKGDDYVSMGRIIAEKASPKIPVLFFQEGGYRMDRVAQAASDVLTSFCQNRFKES